MQRNLVGVVGLVCATLWQGAPAGATPDAPALGSTHWVGAQHFQHAGLDESGRALWIYPHLDGVLEVFTAEGERSPWVGSLGSSYDPTVGRFLERFQVQAVVDDLLADDAPSSRRRRAARRLALFARLHPAQGGPSYLDPARRALNRHLDDAGAAWVEAAVDAHERVLARVPDPGTRVVPVPAALRSSDDHYRALVADGYLDIAIVGGNSENEETGELYSGSMAGDLLDALRAMAFEVAPRDPQSNVAEAERNARFFEHPVRVRLRLTAAGSDAAATRRSVANFVDGLALADVVVYYGHSNKGSGYYLSERKSDFARFGLDSTQADADLTTRCYGLGRKPHQLLALNSCLSYERYCLPMRGHYDADPAAAPPGFVGAARRVPVDDFAPRVARLIELLLRAAGPRELTREVNALRPRGADSPELLFRGVLQPRNSFVVPPGVRILSVTQRGAEQGFRVDGAGSDGQVYSSSEVFPQDSPGQLVQVIPHDDGVHGLTLDGRLLEVSDATRGAPLEVVAPDGGGRIVFAAWAKRRGKRRLYLLDAEGQLRQLARGGDRLVRTKHAPAPAGARLVAFGNTPDGGFAAIDEAGRAYLSSSRRWKPLDEPPELEVTPSLWRGAELVFAD